MENLNAIEKEIRRAMAMKMLERSQLPLEIEGDPIYNGELTIENYRELFPDTDDYNSVYVTIKQLNPKLAEGVAEILKIDFLKQAAVIRRDYEAAGRIKKKEVEIYQTLMDMLSK